MRRVVITGMGIVSPLGCGVEHNWNRLIKGDSGIGLIDYFDTTDYKTKIAGQIDLETNPENPTKGLFNANDWVPEKDQRKMDKFILYAMAAATQAVEDSGWKPEDQEGQERTGVMIGSGIGGLEKVYEGSVLLGENGGKQRVSPFFLPSVLINLASGQVSIKYGFKGPNHAVVTACSTGAHAIGDASRLIQYGDADVMVAGGAEAPICNIGIAGFNAARALSTRNDDPQGASRPWDKDRDGFVMGEGSGVVVLEEYEHAKARGAKIYGEILGYGMSGDAHHITAPAADGDGAYRAMRAALKNGGVNPEEVDYINAHGTSTPLGDNIEVTAVKRMFGAHANKLTMSSTKSSIGHLLGAAGSAEAIFTTLALRHNIVPPTLNLENPSEGCDIDLAPKVAKERPIRKALTNSFGFGGTNASLVIGSI